MSDKQLHSCPLGSKSREKEAGTLEHQISGEVILVVTFQIFSAGMLLKKTAPTDITTFHRLLNHLCINYRKHTKLLLIINGRKILSHLTGILIYEHRNLEERRVLDIILEMFMLMDFKNA